MIDGIRAEYTLRIDNNGHLAGMVLRSDLGDLGVPTSAAAFQVDKFAIVGPGSQPQVPFAVYATPTVVDGVTIPAGVYLNKANIQRASVGTLEIAGGAVTATVRAFSPAYVDVLSTTEVDLISITVDREGGLSTDLHFSCNFDGFGDAIPLFRIYRSTDNGVTWALVRGYAGGPTIGGRQTLATFATVDPDAGSGPTIFKVVAAKVEAQFTGGFDADLRVFRAYLAATQFKR